LRITRLEAWLVNLRLAEPYTVAYERIDTAPNVFLRIETDKRTIGFGCVNPDEAVCGETPGSILAALDGPAREALLGADPRFVTRLRERIRKCLPDAPGARAGVDMALYDLLGKTAGMPVYQLLGAYRNRIVTSVTIGILDEAGTVARARDLVAQGFRALKIKGGLEVDGDIARVLAVRSAVGDSIAIRFDANQGYDVPDSLRFVNGVRRARLELVEQPTARDALDELASVTRRTSLPIMADESLMGLRDAFRIARGGLADMINVKLMKCGGIGPAMEIASVARSARLKVMVGCMDESALGIAAALHFALAQPAVEFADLDGHLDLIDDPAAGAVLLKNGALMPNAAKGLFAGDLDR
jgi:L-alanine-DL-glutamate epimerase-like enolase superfamily enzyme